MRLCIGSTRRGRKLTLSEEERSRHVHIVGASGTGKSKLLECIIRQDILAGHGLCLVDPHGTLADAIVEFCASRRVDRARKVHVIEAANADWTVGFNPLRIDGMTEPATRVDATVNAFAQVWGGENTSATPLLKKCLRAVFHALMERNLTILEAIELITSSDHRALRKMLTEGLSDYVFNSLWGDFNALSRREFAETFASTNNRLIEFLASPVVRRIVGQREHALDLRRVMDNGEIIIVNLARKGVLSPDNARLIGTLLTSELFLLALSRDERTARRRPFYLYIDECYDFLTSDVERMLDQTRKFGLHVTLSHQRLGQLRDRSESIYNGVMTGGQTKVIFGGLEDDDAEILARQVMRSSFDLERPKRVLDKPVVVDEIPYWLESESTSESEGTTTTVAESRGSSSSASISATDSTSFRLMPDETYEETGVTQSDSSQMGVGEFSTWSESEAQTRSFSTSRGRSQTLKPVRAILPTAVYSLEEIKHLAIVKLRELPRQAAIVKRRGSVATRLVIPEIRPSLATREMIDQFKARTRAASPYLIEASLADIEIRARHESLLQMSEAPAADVSFWHPDEATIREPPRGGGA